jgi:hypothetical protein
MRLLRRRSTVVEAKDADGVGPAAGSPRNGDHGGRGPRIGNEQRSRTLRWVGLAALLGFVGGWGGLLLAIVIGSIDAWLSPRPRALIAAAVATTAAIPLVIVAHGLPPAFFVSPRFVSRNMAAHYLAGTAIVLLVLGIVRDTRERTGAVGALLSPPPAGPGPLATAVDLRPEAPSGPPDDASPAAAPPTLEPRERRSLRALVSGFWFPVVALAIADVVLRYAVAGSASPDPLSARIGANLVGGAGFVLPGPVGGLAPTALRAPAVPALLALGQVSAAPAFFLRALWAALGGGVVVVTGLAARRWFGARAGIAAAALVALLPAFWLESVRIESAPLAQLMVALLLLVLAPGDPGFGVGRALGAGAIGGLLTLVRPEGLVLAAVLLLASVPAVHWVHLDQRTRLRAAASLVLAFAIVAGPWVGRNWDLFREPLPVTETGRVLAGANAASAYGGVFRGSFDPGAARTAEQAASVTPAGEGVLDRRLRARAFSSAAHHPLGLLEALVGRALRTFELWSPANEREAHASRGLATKGWTLQWLGFLPLLALAALGYRRLWPERRGRALPLFAAPAAALAVGVLTYGEPLARSSIDPVLAVVAASWLTGIGGRPRSRFLRRRGVEPDGDGKSPRGRRPAIDDGSVAKPAESRRSLWRRKVRSDG